MFSLLHEGKFNKNTKVEQLTNMFLSRGEEKGLTVKDPFNLVTLALKFDLLLENFNLGCYLVMVAIQRSSSSDNSYWLRSYCQGWFKV